ncbi:MAG: hypothetical protein ACR2OO_02635, partial [Thermomicrobiales bacterium]
PVQEGAPVKPIRIATTSLAVSLIALLGLGGNAADASSAGQRGTGGFDGCQVNLADDGSGFYNVDFGGGS